MQKKTALTHTHSPDLQSSEEVCMGSAAAAGSGAGAALTSSVFAPVVPRVVPPVHNGTKSTCIHNKPVKFMWDQKYKTASTPNPTTAFLSNMLSFLFWYSGEKVYPCQLRYFNLNYSHKFFFCLVCFSLYVLYWARKPGLFLYIGKNILKLWLQSVLIILHLNHNLSRNSPTNVIFGVAATFLTMLTELVVLLATVLLPAPTAEMVEDVALGTETVELPVVVTRTGSVEGMGFPSFVCSFTTWKQMAGFKPRAYVL